MKANNNDFYKVEILSTGNYKVGNLIINPKKVDYAENSLKHLEKRKQIQENYIASLEQKLAEARNVIGVLNMIKFEIQEEVISQNIPILEVEIVKITSSKTGKIKESAMVTPEEAEQLISISNKWMLKSTWEEIYNNKVEA